MIIVLRMPRIQPIGVTMSSAKAGRNECETASWMNGQFQPGVASS